MELPSKLLEEIAYNTRPKIEEHMLILTDKSTHEEHLFQPLQTNNKQYNITITFLSAYNGIFNVTNRNDKFYFKKALIDENFIQIRVPEGAYEIESLNDEIKRTIIYKEHSTEANYPFSIKPNFSTLGSSVEIKPQGAITGFVFDDSIDKLLGFNETILWKNIIYHPIPLIYFPLIIFLLNVILLRV